MDYNSFMTLCYAAAGASILFAVISVLLFLKLRIRAVIGDISGSTAKKAIENIRNQNAQTKSKAHKSSPVNQARGRVTDKITPSGNLPPAERESIYVNVGTERIAASEETEVLGIESCDSDTTVLTSRTNELPSSEPMALPEETTVLENPGVYIAIEEKITFIHSNESVE